MKNYSSSPIWWYKCGLSDSPNSWLIRIFQMFGHGDWLNGPIVPRRVSDRTFFLKPSRKRCCFSAGFATWGESKPNIVVDHLCWKNLLRVMPTQRTNLVLSCLKIWFLGNPKEDTHQHSNMALGSINISVVYINIPVLSFLFHLFFIYLTRLTAMHCYSLSMGVISHKKALVISQVWGKHLFSVVFITPFFVCIISLVALHWQFKYI